MWGYIRKRARYFGGITERNKFSSNVTVVWTIHDGRVHSVKYKGNNHRVNSVPKKRHNGCVRNHLHCFYYSTISMRLINVCSFTMLLHVPEDFTFLILHQELSVFVITRQ